MGPCEFRFRTVEPRSTEAFEGIGLKIVKELQKTNYHLKNLAWSSSGCLDKLNFVERRLEASLQSGSETARHLCQIAVENDMEMSGGSLKWAYRQSLEVYMNWRQARINLKQDYGKMKWSLIVSSAVFWIESEACMMEETDSVEALRIRNNLKAFIKWMPSFWGGAGVEAGKVMETYAQIENREAIALGLFESSDEAHEWSGGVAFRTKQLLEPNGDLQREHRD